MPEKNLRRSPAIIAATLLGELAFEIALPVIAFTKFGQWLDDRYGWGSKALMSGFILAFVISAVIVWKRAKYFRELYERGEL